MVETGGHSRNSHWFRFSLRTLLIVVTVFGCWLGFQLNWIRQRRDFFHEEEQRIDEFLFEREIRQSFFNFLMPNYRPAPRTLRLFSETGLEHVNVFVKAADHTQLTNADLERHSLGKSLFPEADVGFFFSGIFDEPPPP